MRMIILAGIIVAALIGGYFFLNQSDRSLTMRDNSVRDSLLGEWSLYLDCPNTVLSFEQDNNVSLIDCDEDGETLPNEEGTYMINDRDILTSFPGAGEMNFTLVDREGEQRLRLFRFDQEFLFFKFQR